MAFVNRIKFKIIWICILFTLLPKYSYLQTLRADSAGSSIDLRCDIPNLNVYLDNVYIGKTPLLKYSLFPGKYTIRVQNPNPLNWLSRDWESTFSINNHEHRIIVVQFSHMYWIGSTPTSASIYVDGYLIGKTPTAVTLSDSSIHYLTLEYPGYQSYTIDLNTPLPEIIHVILEKTSANKTITPKKYFSLRSRKNWIIGSGILALASGVAGYYYKDRAERAYQNYLQLGNPEQMNRYFDDSQRFDTYSGILYGIGEICLGITIYLAILGTSKD